MIDHSLAEAVELFKSRDLKKRMAAIDMAVQIPGREAIALFMKALQDQSWTLREYAVPRIITAGRPATMPLVQQLQNGVWFTRAAAAKALGVIGDERAIPALVPLAEDGNRSVSQAAAEALADIAAKADPEAVAGQLIRMRPRDGQAFLALVKSVNPDAHQMISEASSKQFMPAGESFDEPGSGDESERLQQLRKAIKAVLRSDSQEDNEES